MEIEALIQLLHDLVLLPSETEWVEFKLNKGSVTNEQIGEYISAMSNGACIKNKPFGYIIWGVKNESHELAGTNFSFSSAKQGNQDLELWLRILIHPKLNFTIHEMDFETRHFVMLQIPAAVGEPTHFQKKAFIRIGSNKTDLRNFPDLVRQIYNSYKDWSAEIVENASLSDLDPEAVFMARQKFVERNPNIVKEINSWDDLTFLDKAKITINGKITRTALILLGKEESSHYLLPAVAQITWKLDTEEKAYEHYGAPLLLSTTRVGNKIRNYKYKFFPDNELLSVTVDKYENKVILEALHNCIAHQNYLENSRILLIEKTDRLIFTNAGSFFEGSPEDYFLGDKTPKRYRNPWLAQAMVNLNMIDTLGYGIHRMFLEQRKRFFPMPQYNLQRTSQVELVIYGHSIDENYSKLLLRNTDLPLSTIILLDRFQKKLSLPEKELSNLKKAGLITGRKPNYHISEQLAEKSGQLDSYLKNRGFDKEYYKKLVVEFIVKKKNGVSKGEIKSLLWDKLPDLMNDKQKLNKVSNIIQELRRENKIKNTGADSNPSWISVK
ncbi:MAG: putative DNA binding domain-containing protein [Bacteroidales bacterium]|nr:putative DNA binding domain-containing protein [Bacteroidales bacterium]